MVSSDFAGRKKLLLFDVDDTLTIPRRVWAITELTRDKPADLDSAACVQGDDRRTS